MANIFNRNYKFDEPEMTSTQDREYFTTSVAYTDGNEKIGAISDCASTIEPKEMYCPDCGCPLIVQDGELVHAEEAHLDDDEFHLQTCVAYEEVEEDLLGLPSYYNICYGVPADLSLGSETARRLNGYYHIIDKVADDFEDRAAGEVIWIQNLFLLMISNRKYEPITMANLERCIKDLAQYCVNEEVEYLGMPLIGCGKGGLDWEEVRAMIIDTFTEAIVEAIENKTLRGDYRLHITFCFNSAVTNLTE